VDDINLIYKEPKIEFMLSPYIKDYRIIHLHLGIIAEFSRDIVKKGESHVKALFHTFL